MNRLNEYILPLKRECGFCYGTGYIVFGKNKVICGAKYCEGGFVKLRELEIEKEIGEL